MGARQTVIADAGRRFGKSRAGAAGALWNLLCIPELDAMVSVGEKRYAVCIANSQLQARIFRDHALSIVEASPALRGELETANEDELIFRGGRILASFPCNARRSRLAGQLSRVEEFAHFYDEEGAARLPRRESGRRRFRRVAQFGSLGRVVVCSTPLGASGLFAELYAKAKNGELPAPKPSTPPASITLYSIPRSSKRSAVVLGDDDYAREYGAEFLSGGASSSSPTASPRSSPIGSSYRAKPARTGGPHLIQPSPVIRPRWRLSGEILSTRERLVLGWAGRWFLPVSIAARDGRAKSRSR